jgi:acetyltransferase-like isoleucine patch superfamily enzyme
MRCYLDDLCYDLLKIGNNVIISYGVFFACHGRNQGHSPITIEDGAYIGMRASIISKTPTNDGVIIGKKAVVGACSLVNKNVPDGATAVGVPCRIVKEQ